MTNPTAPEPSREARDLAVQVCYAIFSCAAGPGREWMVADRIALKRTLGGLPTASGRFEQDFGGLCAEAFQEHIAPVLDAALQSARDEAYEKCLAAAAEQERCERGFKQLAHEAGDMQRMSDFEEGESVAKTIGDAIRALKGRSA